MSDNVYQLLAIAVYLAGMLAIGYFAYKKTDDLDDYMLAGRDLKPGVAALSAGASDMSRSEERRVGKECRSRWSPYH